MIEKKPYHHLSDGTFRNPNGSPKRDPNLKWAFKIFNEEKVQIILSKCLDQDELESMSVLDFQELFTVKENSF